MKNKKAILVIGVFLVFATCIPFSALAVQSATNSEPTRVFTQDGKMFLRLPDGNVRELLPITGETKPDDPERPDGLNQPITDPSIQSSKDLLPIKESPPYKAFKSSIINEESLRISILTRINNMDAEKDVVFNDLINVWNVGLIVLFTKLGFVNGYENGTFKPEGNITRAEFAALIMRVFNISVDVEGQTYASDLADHWSKDYMATLKKKNVIQGYEDNTIRPDALITNAEVVAVLSRIVNFPSNVKLGDQVPTNLEGTWNRKDLESVLALGMIGNGDMESFNPRSPSTRVDCVVALIRCLFLDESISSYLKEENLKKN